MARISRDAGIVAAAVPIIASVTGTVANALFAAISYAISGLVAINSERPELYSIWQVARTATFRQSRRLFICRVFLVAGGGSSDDRHFYTKGSHWQIAISGARAPAIYAAPRRSQFSRSVL